MLPLLSHHPAAAGTHHQQHQWIERNGRQAQPGIDGQHRRQGQAVGQRRVGQTQHSKSQQPAHVLHIAGGTADHLAATGLLYPARFLLEQVIENSLAQGHFHLTSRAEHQHSRPEPHQGHRGGQGSDQGGLLQQLRQRETFLEAVDGVLHQQGQAHPHQIHHNQGHGPLE